MLRKLLKYEMLSTSRAFCVSYVGMLAAAVLVRIFVEVAYWQDQVMPENVFFPLVDITITPDDEIMQHRRIAILELLQKHIRQRDLMLLLEQLVTLIDEGYTSGSQLVAMQNYMLQRGHTEQADLFYGVLRDRETGGESMMTLAQWFEEKGIEKGIQQGRQEERQEFALRLLSKGMSREDVAEMANLPLAEIDKVINLI